MGESASVSCYSLQIEYLILLKAFIQKTLEMLVTTCT